MASLWRKSGKRSHKSLQIILAYLSFKPGSRDIVAGLIRRHCPSNFFAFNLALAMGIAAFHGQAIRALTTGQLPVCMLMSEDNGKAQVMKKIFDIVDKCCSSEKE